MRVGSKIICINATKDASVDYKEFTQWVEEGATYHIRRVETGGRLLLDEIKNPSVYFESLMGKTEPGFHKKRFADYEQYILGNIKEEENEVQSV